MCWYGECLDPSCLHNPPMSNSDFGHWPLSSSLNTWTKREPSPRTLPPRARDNGKGWESANLHASFQLGNVWLMEKWACMTTIINIKFIPPTSVCLDHRRSLCGMRTWVVAHRQHTQTTKFLNSSQNWACDNSQWHTPLEYRNHRWETRRHFTVQSNLYTSLYLVLRLDERIQQLIHVYNGFTIVCHQANKGCVPFIDDLGERRWTRAH
jgi:hypothetical protein